MEPNWEGEPAPHSEVVREYLEADNWKSTFKPNVFRASDTWKCLRALWYSRRGIPTDEGKRLPLGLFDAGKNVEASFIRALQARYGEDAVLTQFWVRRVIKAPDGTKIVVRGKPDALVVRYNLEPYELVEVKSKSGIYPDHTANTEHIGQGAVYFFELRKLARSGFPKYSVTYISRNATDELKQEPITLANEDEKLLDDFFIQAAANDLKDTAPPAIPSEGYQCKFCDFKKRCKDVEGWEKGGSPWKLADELNAARRANK